jgi:hypothetical protein
MRATPELRSPLPAGLALAGIALFFGGGAGNDALPWLGGGAALLALVLAATRPLPQNLRVFVPLAALAVWCALSIAWSVGPDRSWAFANRCFVYLAFGLVGAFLASHLRGLMLGFCGLFGAVCAWALAGKVLPWLYEDYERVARLRAPIGYWNSLALVGAIALPLGLCLATRWRWQGTLLVYGWIVALGLTYSRGGVLVAAIVVVAWSVLSRAWLETVATLVAAGIPAAIVLGVAFLLPGVTSNGQPHSVRVQDGLVFGLVLAAGAAAAVFAARVPPPEPTLAVRRAALALVGAVAAALLLVGAINASSWWDALTGPAAGELPNSPGRFVDTGSNYRSDWWSQAWQGWEEHRVAGTGAGTFAFTNLRLRTTELDVATEPHSLPMQFLSETGIVGLVLFAAAVVALIVPARRRPGPQLALALALPAFVLHGLVDIGWSFAGVSAPVFMIAGALAARPGTRRLSPPELVTASGIALALVFSLFSIWLADRWTAQANGRLDQPREAIDLARRARSLNPLSVEPLAVEALAEQVLARRSKTVPARNRHYGRALGLLEKATEVQPENAEAWFRLGQFNFRVRNCPRLALPQLDRFTALNPQDSGNREYDRALAAVNSGRPIC